LIIPLIVQATELAPSGPDQIDVAPIVSRPFPFSSDQFDAEHQATELALGWSMTAQLAPGLWDSEC
jgi:hypothetical protein